MEVSMRRIRSLGIVSFLVVILLSGCDLLPTFKKSSSKTSVVPKSTGLVLARINGWVLTVDEFDKQIVALVKLNGGDSNIPLEALGILAGTLISTATGKIDLSSPEGKKTYLDLLINQELLAQEARYRGIDKTSDVVKSIRKNTVEILGFTLLSDTLKNVKVTPLEVEDLYNSDYKKMSESIERRKIREIVVNSESKARDLLIEILTGAGFAEVATRNSIVETASNGGLLKVGEQEYLIPQQNLKFQKFWDIAFTLDKDGVSSVFKDPAKREYYIIKVEDISKGVSKSLDEVYSELEYFLFQGKSIDAIEKLMESVKSRFEANLIINSNLLN
jgi:hypothetical protein